MYIIKEVNSDGTSREFTFSDSREMTKALAPLFADSTKAQRIVDGQKINDELRRQYRERQIDPSVFFHRGNN